MQIKLYTIQAGDFCKRREHPAPYSHDVLFDHQDWMAAHRPGALAKESPLILENGRPGTVILRRSASPEIDFIRWKMGRRLRREWV